MTLFLFQHKIPFVSVIDYLRFFAPNSTMSPELWADKQTGNIMPGDLLFILEPEYSPWGDSSSGIGVSEGDSFKVTDLAIAHKWENGVICYVISPESYQRYLLKDYLVNRVQTAKSQNGGFYYAL